MKGELARITVIKIESTKVDATKGNMKVICAKVANVRTVSTRVNKMCV